MEHINIRAAHVFKHIVSYLFMDFKFIFNEKDSIILRSPWAFHLKIIKKIKAIRLLFSPNAYRFYGLHAAIDNKSYIEIILNPHHKTSTIVDTIEHECLHSSLYYIDPNFNTEESVEFIQSALK